jgi:predicted nucleotidyltransferase
MNSELEKLIHPNTILLGYVGSIAHGTHIPPEDPKGIDDKDVMGVSVGKPEHYYNCLISTYFKPKQIQEGEWDYIPYEICKFFKLLLKQNPNVVSLLYLTDNHYLRITEEGKELLRNKNIFVSKEAYHSFAGYANQQLYRMEHYTYEGYMGEKRKALVNKFGYDCKNAAHLIRLLRMAIEFLIDGEFRVFRPDREELKEIKQGLWTLQRIKSYSTELFELAREAYVKSDLPPKPDYEAAQKLLVRLVSKMV